MAVIGDEQGVIVGDLLGEEGNNEGEGEEEKGVPCALDGAEAIEAFFGKI
jgi:hypothetical protein